MGEQWEPTALRQLQQMVVKKKKMMHKYTAKRLKWNNDSSNTERESTTPATDDTDKTSTSSA